MSLEKSGVVIPEERRNTTLSYEHESDIAFGPFRFDRTERMLRRDGEEIRLPPRVIGVLEFLLERRGKIVSKRALMEGVWSGTAVAETSLTEAISLLRQALGDDVQNPQYLETVHRRGYRFRGGEGPGVEGPPQVKRESGLPRRATMITLLVTTGVVVIAVATYLLVPERELPKPAHVTIAFDGDLTEFSPPAISPNGREIVFIAREGNKQRLYHRTLDDFITRAIAETKNAYSPFFSPDGEWVGYVNDGFLVKVELSVGTPIKICRVQAGRGAVWTRDGWIIFAKETGGLARVSAEGGTPETLTVPNARASEIAHYAPAILPDGKSVLFTVFTSSVGNAKTALLSLDTKKTRVILENAAGARWIPGGYIAWLAGDAVNIARFDADLGRVTGAPIVVLRDVEYSRAGVLLLSVANDGTIAYISGLDRRSPREIVRRDAAGRITPLPTPVRDYQSLRIAPDGKRAAVTILDGERSDVWIADLETGTLNRVSFEGFNEEATWSPDGKWLYYSSNRSGAYNIYRRRVGGEGGEERFIESALHQLSLAWSPDGKILVVGQLDRVTGADIHLFEQAKDGSWKSRPFARTPAADMDAEISPDGRWIAYASCTSAKCVINVQDFPQGRGNWQISTERGSRPFWSVDGKTLYYRSGRNLLALPLTFDGGAIRRGREEVLDSWPVSVQRGRVPGELTFIRATEQQPRRRELRLITGWAAGIESR